MERRRELRQLRAQMHPEDYAYILEQRRLERALRRHIEQAVEAGLERFGQRSNYTFQHIRHVLEECEQAWSAQYPPTAPHGMQKRPIARTLAIRVFERDQYRCVTCGDWRDLCADHILAESKGGPTTFENLQTLCRSCNSRKGARP